MTKSRVQKGGGCHSLVGDVSLSARWGGGGGSGGSKFKSVSTPVEGDSVWLALRISPAVDRGAVFYFHFLKYL